MKLRLFFTLWFLTSTVMLAVGQGGAADKAARVSPVEMLEGWRRANPDLAANTAPVREIVLPPALAKPASAQESWGADLPADVSTSIDLAALVSAIGKADYLIADPTQTETKWADDLGACRALILPDSTALGDDDVGRIREFVKNGGVLIAFGHASLLDPSGKQRPNYPLNDVFGAHLDGLVKFYTEVTRVTVTADSIYAPQFAPDRVIDGASEGSKNFWASREAPMPHWVEIAFSAPRKVGQADVTCRPGFLLRDFEVQCKVNDQWLAAAKVANNEVSVIKCPFDKPVETSAVRLFITKEMLDGKDRQIADVGEITLYNEAGRRLIPPPYLIEAGINDQAWAKANRSGRIVLRSPAVRIRPEGAKVLAAFADPLASGELPFCTCNNFGKGRAYLLAVPESCLGSEPDSWEVLLRTFVGMPSVRHSGDEDVRAFLLRGDGRCVLHVIDTLPAKAADRAKEVIVRLNTAALGAIQAARLLPDKKDLTLKVRGEWVQFTVPMCPMASILLELKR